MLFVCNRFADCLAIPDRLFTNINNFSLTQLVKQNLLLNRCYTFVVSNLDVVVVNY